MNMLLRDRDTHARRVFIQVTPELRELLERIAEATIEALDEIDGNPDLEANGDDEPTLGWATQHTGAIRHGVEVVADGEAEASLGWCGHGCGQNWSSPWDGGMSYDLEHDELDRGEECW